MIQMKQMTLQILSALTMTFAASAQVERPSVPQTPAPVRKILSVQPFELAMPARHLWRAEKPEVRTGYLIVLEVDPALVLPRQVAEPVLYVGHQTAERINVGYESGHVVAIVPGVTDPESDSYLDLAETLIWFGTPELPERIDGERIATEHANARAAGIRPRGKRELEAARVLGGRLNMQPGKIQLMNDAVVRLVARFSPQEGALIEQALRSRESLENGR